MKNIISFLVLLTINGVAYANIDGYYGVINDPDGYTNIRKQDNLKSPVITKLSNSTPLSIECEDSSIDKNFCSVRFGKTQDGFVYKNRLNLLTANATFNKIPLTSVSRDKTQGAFSNKDVRVNVAFSPVKIDIKNFNEQTSSKFGINKSDPVVDYYKLRDIKVTFKNRVITLPSSATQDIYLSRYFLANDAIANDIGVYQNKKDNHLYIIGRFADGALLYSVIYEIKDGKYFRKSVWSEAI